MKIVGVNLWTYCSVSIVVGAAVIANAYMTREQLFPTLEYLSTSKAPLLAMGNLGVMCMILLGQIVKKIFLGSLRPEQIEPLNERIVMAITDTLLVMTIFREEFGTRFLFRFFWLLFSKIFHWLASDKVTYMEMNPNASRLTHIRTSMLMGLLLAIDLTWVYVADLLQSHMGLQLSSCLASNIWTDGRFDKGVYLVYLELINDLLRLILYLVFFMIIYTYYGLPFNIIRQTYLTVLSFQRKLLTVVRYRKVTQNMEARFPEATQEEIQRLSDPICIICHDPLTNPDATEDENNNPQAHNVHFSKKLPCGHIIHFRCLRSLVQEYQRCPICRTTLLVEELNQQDQLLPNWGLANRDNANNNNAGQRGAAPQWPVAAARNIQQPPQLLPQPQQHDHHDHARQQAQAQQRPLNAATFEQQNDPTLQVLHQIQFLQEQVISIQDQILQLQEYVIALRGPNSQNSRSLASSSQSINTSSLTSSSSSVSTTNQEERSYESEKGEKEKQLSSDQPTLSLPPSLSTTTSSSTSSSSTTQQEEDEKEKVRQRRLLRFSNPNNNVQ